MAKGVQVAALVAAALCFASAYASDFLSVEGEVYCDPCRVEFHTTLSTPIEGAEVQLECRSRANGTLSYSAKAVTDKSGKYSIPVAGDHEEDICEVKPTKSGNPECEEPFKGMPSARILITQNVGVVEPKRLANPLGFMKKEALTECTKLLVEMGILPTDAQV